MNRWKKIYDSLSVLSVLACIFSLVGMAVENKPSLLYPAALAIFCLVLSRIGLGLHYALKEKE